MTSEQSAVLCAAATGIAARRGGETHGQTSTFRITTWAASTTRCSTRPAAARRLPAALPPHADDAGRRPDPPPAGGRPLDGAAGHHVQRVRRPGRAPSGSFRSTSCRGSSPRTNGQWLERGLQAADHRAQPVHRRHLPRAEDRARRRACPSTSWRPAKGFRQQCVGLNPPRGIWCHITGTDLVRDTRRPDSTCWKTICAARPACRTCCRIAQLMKQTFPQLFERSAIRPVDDYCSRLLDALQYLMRRPDAVARRWRC